MANFSFDVVSEYDKAEINNVFDQVKREIGSRYDFKGTPADIEWLNSDRTGFKLSGNSELQLDSIIDMIRKKLATRNQSQKLIDLSKPLSENNMKVYKEVPFNHGLSQDKAKQITKLIQAENSKVKAQIQGEAVRITSSSKNDLQEIMQSLRSKDFDFPLNFTNYR
jgi:uncharacterized protein YajQ (UPF0234 family)